MKEFLKTKRDLWHANIANWDFIFEVIKIGNDYKNGYYLHRYILETQEYDARIRHTPVDNHCKNVVQIYTSFFGEYHQQEIMEV